MLTTAMLQRELSGAIVPLRRSDRPSLFHYRPGDGRTTAGLQRRVVGVASITRARQPSAVRRAKQTSYSRGRHQATNRMKTKDVRFSGICVLSASLPSGGFSPVLHSEREHTHIYIEWKRYSFLICVHFVSVYDFGYALLDNKRCR